MMVDDEPHTVNSHEEGIALLDKSVAQMGGLTEYVLGLAFDALERRDPRLAEIAVETDRQIDALERGIEAQVTSMIPQRQPTPEELRHILGAMRIASDLERIGDLGKNI